MPRFGLLLPVFILSLGATKISQHLAFVSASKPAKTNALIWRVAQAWSGLRWVIFDGWVAVFRNLQDFGAAQQAQTAISKFAQFLRLAKYAIIAGIPPYQLYQFGLMGSRVSIWSYIFAPEVKGYHALRNANHPGANAAKAALRNKTAFAKEMTTLGITMPKTLAVVHPEQDIDINQLLADHPAGLFCKLAAGSGAKGAFWAKVTKGEFSGQKFDGSPLPDEQAIEIAMQTLCRLGSVIVQPLLANHPKLANLSPQASASTVRLITKSDQTTWAAQLEVPVTRPKHSTYHLLLPIDLKTGHVLAPNNLALLPNSDQTKIAKVLANLPNPLPHWQDLVTASLVAQNHYDLWAIAWDWIISADGPILLEGNAGWALDIVQMQDGGLLNT